ncbi:unnamed protein product [Mytilus edulis]|uniref:Reverse transcriptase domain-containing protein n=1 Tax=Mytilus edulis TaxID=6550 RepID=A0A8S3PTL5_MYTED|nr:unnamed protein product [Mytilus edulis]
MSAVKLGHYMTDIFPVNFGVKQGCKMSPSLFSSYANGLAEDIRALNIGVDIDDLNVSILLYADEIALMVLDEKSLQNMLNCIHSWCMKWRMTLNETKTKIIHFRNKKAPRSDFNFKCGDMPISFDNAYRYLGLHINEFMEHKYTIREITKSASRALSVVYTNFLSCGGMSFDVYTKLYKTLIEPVLLHGARLCGHNNWREVQTI